MLLLMLCDRDTSRWTTFSSHLLLSKSTRKYLPLSRILSVSHFKFYAIYLWQVEYVSISFVSSVCRVIQKNTPTRKSQYLRIAWNFFAPNFAHLFRTKLRSSVLLRAVFTSLTPKWRKHKLERLSQLNKKVGFIKVTRAATTTCIGVSLWYNIYI